MNPLANNNENNYHYVIVSQPVLPDSRPFLT